MSAKPIVLAVENLSVSFDGFKAVNDLNLYVEQNELRVVIGKTTWNALRSPPAPVCAQSLNLHAPLAGQ